MIISFQSSQNADIFRVNGQIEPGDNETLRVTFEKFFESTPKRVLLFTPHCTHLSWLQTLETIKLDAQARGIAFEISTENESIEESERQLLEFSIENLERTLKAKNEAKAHAASVLEALKRENETLKHNLKNKLEKNTENNTKNQPKSWLDRFWGNGH